MCAASTQRKTFSYPDAPRESCWVLQAHNERHPPIHMLREEAAGCCRHTTKDILLSRCSGRELLRAAGTQRKMSSYPHAPRMSRCVLQAHNERYPPIHMLRERAAACCRHTAKNVLLSTCFENEPLCAAGTQRRTFSYPDAPRTSRCVLQAHNERHSPIQMLQERAAGYRKRTAKSTPPIGGWTKPFYSSCRNTWGSASGRSVGSMARWVYLWAHTSPAQPWR